MFITVTAIIDIGAIPLLIMCQWSKFGSCASIGINPNRKTTVYCYQDTLNGPRHTTVSNNYRNDASQQLLFEFIALNTLMAMEWVIVPVLDPNAKRLLGWYICIPAVKCQVLVSSGLLSFDEETSVVTVVFEVMCSKSQHPPSNKFLLILLGRFKMCEIYYRNICIQDSCYTIGN